MTALDRVRELCDEADAKSPDDFRSGQDHLPRAFREIDYRAAFMWLAEIVTRIEAAAARPDDPFDVVLTTEPGTPERAAELAAIADRQATWQAGREQAFRDAEHALRRHAQVWEEDGTDPCRVRISVQHAESLEAWADGIASPDGPAAMWRAHLTAVADAPPDPTHGSIDPDIRAKVDEWGGPGLPLGTRTAVENTLQARRDGGALGLPDPTYCRSCGTDPCRFAGNDTPGDHP